LLFIVLILARVLSLLKPGCGKYRTDRRASSLLLLLLLLLLFLPPSLPPSLPLPLLPNPRLLRPHVLRGPKTTKQILASITL